MDLLTHALVGAGAGAATRPGANMRLAGAAGAFAALLVDVDYFIGSASDPLLQIEFHRHFTHALIFIPVGALVATLLLWPLIGRALGFRSLYLATLAGYATHGFIDSCTSYGVHLFWPFAEERVALDLVSVVDPLFTLLIGIPVAWSLWYRSRRSLWLALVGGVLYLLFAAWQQQRAIDLAVALAEDRGHAPTEVLARPSFGNTQLWRAVYRHGDRWYVDAVRPGLLAAPQSYPGGSLSVFHRAQHLPQVPGDTRIGRDIDRLDRLSDGYLVWVSRDASTEDVVWVSREAAPEDVSWVSREAEEANVWVSRVGRVGGVAEPGGVGRLGDIRFSAVPDGLRPMWGLEFDPARPEEPPSWFVDRTLTPKMRTRFLDQLLGRND